MQRQRVFLICVATAAAFAASGCDTLMTSTPTEGDDFTAPMDDMSMDLNAAFAEGDENFERVFTVADGLGPIFNNTGCESCHPGDGRGSPDLGFFRISEGLDPRVDLGGAQIQDKAIPGQRPETVPPGVDVTFRLPPPVFGVGLMEGIPESTILAAADPDDADGDGISGRPNMVTSPAFVPDTHVGGGPGMHVGRFSRKGQVASLLEQVAFAYQQDIGVTSDFIPEEIVNRQVVGNAVLGDLVPDPEISASTVLMTVMYVRLLQPPARGEITPEVERGDAVFTEIGCASCHTPSMRTGPNEIPQLSEVDAQLYSDLLIHDMGPALADNRPDGDANGFEWKTAPLWGTRLVAEFLNGEGAFLHDGRASSAEEAIGFHGGEAEASRNRFQALSDGDRQALVAFLESL